MIPVARPIVGDEERAAVDAVLAGGGLAQGPKVAQFEHGFGHGSDGRICVAVNSGTSALHLGMLALGIGPGDEVIVPSFTFAATANAVCLTGATPVFVDIDPVTFCMDPDAARAAITSVYLSDHARAPLRSSCRHGETGAAGAGAWSATSSRTRHRPTGPPSARAPSEPSGSCWRFLLLPDEEHDLRRGRDGDHGRREPGQDSPTAAQPGYGGPLPERDRRIQQPHDRHPRRDRNRAVGRSSQAGPSNDVATPSSSQPTSAVS